jgi:hypothetical protein
VANALEAQRPVASQRVRITGSSAVICDLELTRREVVDFLRSRSEDEREIALVHAVELGVFCLERAQASLDTEFVRRQVERLLADVDRAATGIPGAIEGALAAKIGTGEGQVLEPVDRIVKAAEKAVADKLAEVRNLFADELDPAKETGALGKALRSVRDQLDPARADSIQGAVRAAVQAITGGDGPVARAVRDVVTEAVKPLKEEVDGLAKEVRGRDAAREALEQTTQKGATYETQVVEELQIWAKVVGAQVEHVGGDNRPGDVLVALTDGSLAGVPLRIVVEARDRQTAAGRKVIADTVAQAIRERSADSGIYVSATRSGLGIDVGDFAEGDTEAGRFVACTHNNIRLALRLLLIQARLDRGTEASSEVKKGLLLDQMGRVRSALERIKTINRRVTEVRSGADGIEEEARALREEIRDALAKMEDAIRAAAGGQEAA